MNTQTITIIGMRRTGLSIGLALKKSSIQLTVVGHDSDRALINEALSQQAIDQGEPDLLKAVVPADIIILAMPLLELSNTLQLIGDRLQPHTLIIDLTELKEIGYKLAGRYLQQGFYISAKPVFSLDLDDHDDAHSDLFRNSIFCVMPQSQTDPQAVETAVSFGRLVGATPYFLDAGEYDVLVNGVEVLPGLIAEGLFKTIRGATSWRDVIRFADLPFITTTSTMENDPDELAHLAVKNKEATLRWFDSFTQEMEKLRRMIAEGDEELMAAYFQEMNRDRFVWIRERKENDWVEDKPEEVDTVSFSDRLLGSYAKKRLGRSS